MSLSTSFRSKEKGNNQLLKTFKDLSERNSIFRVTFRKAVVLNDEQIIKKLRSASQQEQNDALKFLYKEYFTMAVHLIRSNNGDADDAKDVFQDSLITIFNKVRQPDYETGSSLKTFLYAVCRNIWLKKLRTSGYDYKFRETQDANETVESISEIMEADEKQKTLITLINNLGDDCKKILLYFYYEKLSMQEIVEQMGLSGEQVAKNKKLHCMNKLREMVLSNSSTIEILRN